MARVKHPRHHAIENAAEIRALASPTRIELVDTLEALGDASVAELARQLGRPADGLYYHLHALASAGLIVEDAGAEGRRYRTRTPRGEGLRLRYRPGATANARAVAKVAGSVLRISDRDFRRALADPETVIDGELRELWASRGKGWVGATELAEINRLLTRLMLLLRRPRSPIRGRLIALSWILAPVDAKPPRRVRTTRQKSGLR